MRATSNELRGFRRSRIPSALLIKISLARTQTHTKRERERERETKGDTKLSR